MGVKKYITLNRYIYFQLLFAPRNVTVLLYLLLSGIKSFYHVTNFDSLLEKATFIENVLSE